MDSSNEERMKAAQKTYERACSMMPNGGIGGVAGVDFVVSTANTVSVRMELTPEELAALVEWRLSGE